MWVNFSRMKIIKSKHHFTMTDHHLEACWRLGTNSYYKNNAILADSI